MISWKNLDTLKAYEKLSGLKNHVNLAEAMSGESGAKRVAEYSVPMAGGLMATDTGPTGFAHRAWKVTPSSGII